MKKTSYKDKPAAELVKTLMEKREELRKLKFGATGSKNRDVKSLSNLRKEIARVMTELNRHE